MIPNDRSHNATTGYAERLNLYELGDCEGVEFTEDVYALTPVRILVFCLLSESQAHAKCRNVIGFEVTRN